MSQSIHEQKITLQTEKKRCLAFLRDKELNLPAHLQQTADILSTQEHLEMINKKLEKIAKAEAKEAAAKAKAVQDSLKMVEEIKGKIWLIREEINSSVSKLEGQHKGLFFDLSNTLSQLLRNFEPKDK